MGKIERLHVIKTSQSEIRVKENYYPMKYARSIFQIRDIKRQFTTNLQTMHFAFWYTVV